MAIVLLAAIALSGQPSGFAQIVESRDYHGKQITCVRSGLFSFVMPCGIESSYEDIFVGTILSMGEAEDSEKTLNITPEEVFLGNLPHELTVTTRQGDCLGDIAPGDRWLFYLRRDEKTGVLVLMYGSPSGPVADTEETVSLLRRLTKMIHTGLILGDVSRPVRDDDDSETTTYPRNHKIVARRVADGMEYVASTDSHGNYEFEPLPVGSYHLSANTTQGLWAEEGRVKVEPHGCSSVRFELHADGGISGRVTTASGKPVKYASIEVGPLDGGRWGLVTGDEHGYFDVRGLEPGRYLVGIDIQDNSGGLSPRAKAYYPGVRDKDLAVVVTVGPAEKRTNIDFQLPPSGTQ